MVNVLQPDGDQLLLSVTQNLFCYCLLNVFGIIRSHAEKSFFFWFNVFDWDIWAGWCKFMSSYVLNLLLFRCIQTTIKNFPFPPPTESQIDQNITICFLRRTGFVTLIDFLNAQNLLCLKEFFKQNKNDNTLGCLNSIFLNLIFFVCVFWVSIELGRITTNICYTKKFLRNYPKHTNKSSSN